MAKYKSLIVTTLLSVAALTGAVTTGVVRNRSMASSFEGDGYDTLSMWQKPRKV